jgi:hypothetical protein
MRTVRTALLAGVAALGLAGFAGRAEAQIQPTHVLTVQLPDGEVARIHYTGNIPPAVILAPAAMPMAFVAPPAFDTAPPFAILDRMAAEMDRQAAAMLQEVQTLAAAPLPDPERLIQAEFGTPPPGGESYAAVMNVSGNGVCMRSVQITSSGNGSQPRVVTRVSGDCEGKAGAAPAQQRGITNVRAELVGPATPSYGGLIHQIAAREYE